ncbi:MAG: DNA polymerase III subunit delta [Phycisphaerales bacterium]|nr:DNA polymerase III subunit delta [Phycisphaerae bacterium]NNF41905.1 DNA polymerase III subunit delta [Phycisphaerales bacterium]NNM25415.1 DNA polymerase III subunit delta [Phycisphaerales bacterium]
MARRSPDAPPTLDATMRVVILRGPDRYLQLAYTQMLQTALEAEHGEITPFSFDGATAEPAAVLDELRSYGLLQTHKLVIVDAADALLAAPKAVAAETPRKGRGGPTPARTLFERYASDPMESATLLLRAATWRPGKLDKLVAKVGSIVKCEAPDVRTAATWCVARCAKEHDATIQPDAARLLVERIGPELGRLDTELAKLASFVGPGAEITPDAIRSMVGLTREEQAWAIQSILLRGSPAPVVTKLRELLEVSRQPEALVTWAVIDLLRKLHTAAQLLRQGEAPAEVARTLKLWGEARTTVLSAARHVEPDQLAGLLLKAIRADLRSKSGVGRSSRTLEVLAIEVADMIPAA